MVFRESPTRRLHGRARIIDFSPVLSYNMFMDTFLAFDVGNTSIKAGYFDRGRLTMTTSAADAASLVPKLRQFDKPAAAGASSVRPAQDEPLRQAVRDVFGIPLAFLGKDLPAGVTIRCEQPEKVGADRLANAIAGFQRAREHVIVVDFGTAIAFDVISDTGEFLGGAIAPGVSTCLAALHEKTALLPRVEIDEPPSGFGRNTVDAILAGVVGGLPGLVDRIVENIEAETTSKFTVYATGGDSRHVAAQCHTVDEIIPSLTLEGIHQAWKRMLRAQEKQKVVDDGMMR